MLSRRELFGALASLPLLVKEGFRKPTEYVSIIGPILDRKPLSNRCDPEFLLVNETRMAIEHQGVVIPAHSRVMVPRHRIKGHGNDNMAMWIEQSAPKDYKWVKRSLAAPTKEA